MRLLTLIVFVFLLTVFCRVLAKGSRLLCLWTSAQGAAAAGSAGGRKRVPAERIVLQVGVGASSIFINALVFVMVLLLLVNGYIIISMYSALIVLLDFVVTLIMILSTTRQST